MPFGRYNGLLQRSMIDLMWLRHAEKSGGVKFRNLNRNEGKYKSIRHRKVLMFVILNCRIDDNDNEITYYLFDDSLKFPLRTE